MSKYQSKHNNYELGTQAMLDAAKDDATKLPFNTVFVCNDDRAWLPKGTNCIRSNARTMGQDNAESVRFEDIDGCGYFSHVTALHLLPAKKDKKPKQKKWQNGTQEQLDAAMENAKLIPKKTYFISNRSTTKGKVVYRIDNKNNDKLSVMMMATTDCSTDFYCAKDLGVFDD